MRPLSIPSAVRHLLRDDSASLAWIRHAGLGGVARPISVLVLCSALYGASMGLWRAPLMALFVAVKAPLLLLSVALVNALVNAAFAARSDLRLTMAETLRSVLLSFMLAAVVLAALAPIYGFFSLALPAPNEPGGRQAHDLLGLAHIGTIALAGTIATVRQQRWIERTGASAGHSRALVAVWLGTNLLAGAQISWVMRPWFGTPSLEVAFLRPDPFDGTFYESFLRMLLSK